MVYFFEKNPNVGEIGPKKTHPVNSIWKRSIFVENAREKKPNFFLTDFVTEKVICPQCPHQCPRQYPLYVLREAPVNVHGIGGGGGLRGRDGGGVSSRLGGGVRIRW